MKTLGIVCMKDNIITIDGPSASGKGSLARNIATTLILIF
jgi:cytidylate kinase